MHDEKDEPNEMVMDKRKGSIDGQKEEMRMGAR
jgi:hypothetical protein